MENQIFESDFLPENPDPDILGFPLYAFEQGMKDGFLGVKCEIPLHGLGAHFYTQGFISGTLRKIREINAQKKSPERYDVSWWYLLP